MVATLFMPQCVAMYEYEYFIVIQDQYNDHVCVPSGVGVMLGQIMLLAMLVAHIPGVHEAVPLIGKLASFYVGWHGDAKII